MRYVIGFQANTYVLSIWKRQGGAILQPVQDVDVLMLKDIQLKNISGIAEVVKRISMLKLAQCFTKPKLN